MTDRGPVATFRSVGDLARARSLSRCHVLSTAEPVLAKRGLAGHPYRWTAEAEQVADRLDFLARAGEFTVQPPVLLVSGEEDHPELRTDAATLVGAFRERYAQPDTVELVGVPGLAHPLADEPGTEPAPQRPATRVVDDLLTRWFRGQLAPG